MDENGDVALLFSKAFNAIPKWDAGDAVMTT
jgi:hypothetical protein